MFTKKHYEAIAEIIKDAGNKVTSQGEAVDEIAYELSELFRKDNPRFDNTRFLLACNISFVRR